MPFTKINGRDIYYETHGDGDTIVLLHHGFGCTKMWQDIYPALIKEGYRVIMYDRRGYGRSEKDANFHEFYEGDEFRAESVKELATLTEILNINSFDIIGQCEGGVIGIDYAVKNPDQVNGLVVSSTQCYSPVTMAELNRQKFPKAFSDLDSGLRQKFIDWHGMDNAEPFYNQFRTCGGAYGKGIFDLRGLLPSVACPTLVLYPDRSFLFDVEQAVAFYRHLPEGALAILPGCGHNTYEERPQEYVQLVLEFLKRRRS
ncbi:MAG: alpha/beta hydrolase [Deltaproteobacteria bacterium]|nr:MAG: alpha/beta hydrolase [Deltaproteobacteria bacterium]